MFMLLFLETLENVLYILHVIEHYEKHPRNLLNIARMVLRSRRGCEAPSLMAAPVRTNTSESNDSSSTHNFRGGDCECKQTLCLSRRSHIHPKLSTRCRSIYF